MYLCRNLTDFSYPKIGEYFGIKNHTTVMYACEKISQEMKDNESLKTIIQDLEKELSGN